ncbi:MAG: DUF2752 domain-containing protein [Deltaproteobacteria bacterium]|nr:DUF2752 domain-containing protein [Deltaproteobacteria bacterium]
MHFSLCAIKCLTGFDCPGCGLIHSIFALLGGHLKESIAWHPMGVLVLLGLANLGWRGRFLLSEVGRKIIFCSVLAGFLIPWIVKVVTKGASYV